MINRILSIAGRPGLFRLVTQGKNMLIVESLSDGRRMPVHARDKVISLADVSMYTNDDDASLAQVLQSAKEVTGCQPVDIRQLEAVGELHDFFGKVLPNYDRDRVRTSDIRKLFSWYNLLLAAGITDFAKEETADTEDAQEPAHEAES